MDTKQLIAEIQKKKSFLCIGLDVDLDKIPKFLLKEKDPIFAFNKSIIDATQDFAIAYKPNIAFYEAYGLDGWVSLQKTIDYINRKYPEVFTIADAKRGDIGNTSARYAKCFFETLNFDAITVNPYMGRDSVEPFLEYKEKHTIVLALTSNAGAADFQKKTINNQYFVFQEVIKKTREYANSKNLMFVVGATQSDYLKQIRKIAPDNFLLIPGVGAQGGDLEEVCTNAITAQVGLLINSSRGIIYASNQNDFATQAAAKAQEMQMRMQRFL